jgi:acetyl esterase/lipase
MRIAATPPAECPGVPCGCFPSVVCGAVLPSRSGRSSAMRGCGIWPPTASGTVGQSAPAMQDHARAAQRSGFSPNINVNSRLTPAKSQIRYRADVPPLCSPRINSHSTLSETLDIVVEDDVVRDGGKAYARKLVQVGVSATSIRYSGTIHAAEHWEAKRPRYRFQSGRLGAVHCRPIRRQWHGGSQSCCSR